MTFSPHVGMLKLSVEETDQAFREASFLGLENFEAVATGAIPIGGARKKKREFGLVKITASITNQKGTLSRQAILRTSERSGMYCKNFMGRAFRPKSSSD